MSKNTPSPTSTLGDQLRAAMAVAPQLTVEQSQAAPSLGLITEDVAEVLGRAYQMFSEECSRLLADNQPIITEPSAQATVDSVAPYDLEAYLEENPDDPLSELLADIKADGFFVEIVGHPDTPNQEGLYAPITYIEILVKEREATS